MTSMSVSPDRFFIPSSPVSYRPLRSPQKAFQRVTLSNRGGSRFAPVTGQRCLDDSADVRMMGRSGKNLRGSVYRLGWYARANCSAIMSGLWTVNVQFGLDQTTISMG